MTKKTKQLKVSWNIVLNRNLPACLLSGLLQILKLSRLLFNKQSGQKGCGEQGERSAQTSGVVWGSLFLYAKQVRFFQRHSPQNQTPRAAGWVKTNYGGVKRQAQWGTEKTARFSAPLYTVSAGQWRGDCRSKQCRFVLKMLKILNL